MNPDHHDRLVSRRRRIRRQLTAEVARPVADLSLVRRLMRRAREASQALALSDARVA